eukprot:1140438-Pelagomonas_calceolata.AAC.1
MASPLDHNPYHLHYWSEHPRDRVFGASIMPSHPNSQDSQNVIRFMTAMSCTLPSNMPFTLQYYKLMQQQLSCSYQAGEVQ